MPGVPPDTVDRLKKGIKGLFGKNKKSKDSEPSKSPGDSSKVETSQPSATQLEPAKPAETSKPIEDQPTPSGADSSTADNKDLGDPGKDAQASADVTAPATATEGDNPKKPEESSVTESAKPEEAGSAVKDQAKQEGVGSMPPEPKPREHAEGMSATSGPLQDDPEFSHAAH